MPRADQHASPRSDYRNGATVLPDYFQMVIRPRGVQFGRWQDNRDVVLNETFDAIHDLAHFLCWPVERMTFGGRLAFAFGARGRGPAAAHYEHAQRVINLTRNYGPGCLAHGGPTADHHICGDDPLSSDPRIKQLLSALPKPLFVRASLPTAHVLRGTSRNRVSGSPGPLKAGCSRRSRTIFGEHPRGPECLSRQSVSRTRYRRNARGRGSFDRLFAQL